MSRSAGAPREIAVPAAVFESLRGEFEKEAGTPQTVRALHYAGYHAGLAAAASVDSEAGGHAFGLTQNAFWDQLSGYFAKRGWGQIAHRAAHPSVGLLSSADWAEARTDGQRADGSCSFSAGFLSGMLSELAGGPVAVLEVSCRSRGGASCEFAFGSETAIHDLYGRLLDGDDLDRALGAI